MSADYYTKQVAGQIKLARYLISEADNRGLSHGEKHFLMQTALFILHKVQNTLDDDTVSLIERHQSTDLDPSQIPF
jgi:hypothetical protein